MISTVDLFKKIVDEHEQWQRMEAHCKWLAKKYNKPGDYLYWVEDVPLHVSIKNAGFYPDVSVNTLSEDETLTNGYALRYSIDNKPLSVYLDVYDSKQTVTVLTPINERQEKHNA